MTKILWVTSRNESRHYETIEILSHEKLEKRISRDVVNPADMNGWARDIYGIDRFLEHKGSVPANFIRSAARTLKLEPVLITVPDTYRQVRSEMVRAVLDVRTEYSRLFNKIQFGLKKENMPYGVLSVDYEHEGHNREDKQHYMIVTPKVALFEPTARKQVEEVQRLPEHMIH